MFGAAPVRRWNQANRILEQEVDSWPAQGVVSKRQGDTYCGGSVEEVELLDRVPQPVSVTKWPANTNTWCFRDSTQIGFVVDALPIKEGALAQDINGQMSLQ